VKKINEEKAQWLMLAQQNLRNAYRAADQQYRSRRRKVIFLLQF
jgi:hypothetical protein